MEAIEVKDHQKINLDYAPSSFFSLPNWNLVIVSLESKVLQIYDSEFKLINTIDKINSKAFSPMFNIKSQKIN